MIANEFLSQSEWLGLSQEERLKVRTEFKVGKSGHVKVAQINGVDRVQSDGTEPEDLMASVNVKTVLAYLGEKYDEKKQYQFLALWPLVLKKLGIEVKTAQPVDEKAAQGAAPDPIPPKAKATAAKTGRKMKLEQ